MDARSKRALLRLLIAGSISIRAASRRTGINYETAKAIFRKYRLGGERANDQLQVTRTENLDARTGEDTPMSTPEASPATINASSQSMNPV